MQIDDEAGARVRALRLERGRSQAQLTGPGLSAPYLSLIESGARRPTLSVLERLAELLDSTVEFLATGKGPDTWQEAERRIAFAEIAVVHGSAAEALAELDEVLGECPAPLAERARYTRAQALEALDRREEALAQYELLWSRTEPGSARWAERAVDVMRCHKYLGDTASAAELGEHALATFRRLGLDWSAEAVRLGVTLAGVYQSRGDLARGRRLIEQMIAVADALGSPLARGSAYWNAAMLARDQGRPDDALTLVRKAVALLGETDHLRNIALLRHVYADILLRGDGDPQELRLRLAEARALAEQVGSPIDLAWCEITSATASLRFGEPDQALTHARSAVDRLVGDKAPQPSVRFRVCEAAARAVLALVLARTGEREQAQAELDRAEATIADVRQDESLVETWQSVADAWEALDDPARAIGAYRRALAIAGHPAPAPRWSAPVEDSRRA